MLMTSNPLPGRCFRTEDLTRTHYLQQNYGFLINYCDRLWLPPLITFKISHSLFPKLIHNSISNFSYRDILDSLALLSIIPDYHIANELIACYKHYFIFYLYQFDIIWWIHHIIFDVWAFLSTIFHFFSSLAFSV